jgi:membrane protein DedA with SNARE-associated domain
MDLLFGWIAQYGYGALFVLLMLGIVGLPVPDETLLLFAGYLTFKQKLAVLPTVAAAFLGSVCGITLSYGLGRTVGTYLVRTLGHLIGVDAGKLEEVRAWYLRRGKYALVFGYFVPGVRHLAAVVAGSSKLPPAVFALFAYSGGLFWSVSFLAAGYLLGEEWSRLSAVIHRWLVMVGAVGLAGLAAWFLFVRNRRKDDRGTRDR